MTAACFAVVVVALVQFSSAQDDAYALGKANNMRATSSLRYFPNVAFEIVPMFV